MKTTRGLNLVIGVVAVATATTTLNVQAAQTKPTKKAVSKSITKKASSKTIVSQKPITSPAAVATAPAADSLTSTSASASRASAPTTALVAPVTAGVTTAAAPSASKSLLDREKFRLNLNFYYYGSSISEPFGGYQPDVSSNYAQSENSDPVTLETHLAIGYKFHPNMTFSVNPQFRTVAASSYKQGEAALAKYFTPIASFVRLNFGKFYKSDKFTWNGDLRYYPGVTDDLKGTPLYLRTGQNFMYSVSDKVTLAAYNTVRYYKRTDSAYEKAFAKGQDLFNWRLTASPTIEYQARDNLNLSVSYNMDVIHNSTESFGPRFWNDNNFTYTELGAVWNITPTIEFNPYVDVFTSNNANFNTSQLGANLTFTLL